MELPTDIIDYLSPYLWKAIKPKRYTLLNKRCRDFYYTKNGVYMDLSPDYEITSLCYTYNISINIDDRVIKSITFSKLINKVQKVCKNVIYLKTGEITFNIYSLLRRIFINIQKFKCHISVLDTDQVPSMAVLPGTLVIFADTIYSKMEKIADLGYKFYILNRNNRMNYTDKLRKSVVKINSTYLDFIKYCPNVHTVTNFTQNSGYIDELLKHPNIRKISLGYGGVILPLVKIDGTMIKIKNPIYRGKVITSQSEYDMIKKYYNILCLDNTDDIDRIISYETVSGIDKKLVIDFENFDTKPKHIDRLLVHFNVWITLNMNNSMLEYYVNKAGSYRVKNTRSPAILKFLIGNKLYIRIYYPIRFV